MSSSKTKSSTAEPSQGRLDRQHLEEDLSRAKSCDPPGSRMCNIGACSSEQHVAKQCLDHYTAELSESGQKQHFSDGGREPGGRSARGGRVNRDTKQPPRLGQGGNWRCDECANINYPRRLQCNRCQHSRGLKNNLLVNAYNQFKNQFQRMGLDTSPTVFTQAEMSATETTDQVVPPVAGYSSTDVTSGEGGMTPSFPLPVNSGPLSLQLRSSQSLSFHKSVGSDSFPGDTSAINSLLRGASDFWMSPCESLVLRSDQLGGRQLLRTSQSSGSCEVPCYSNLPRSDSNSFSKPRSYVETSFSLNEFPRQLWQERGGQDQVPVSKDVPSLARRLSGAAKGVSRMAQRLSDSCLPRGSAAKPPGALRGVMDSSDDTSSPSETGVGVGPSDKGGRVQTSAISQTRSALGTALPPLLLPVDSGLGVSAYKFSLNTELNFRESSEQSSASSSIHSLPKPPLGETFVGASTLEAPNVLDGLEATWAPPLHQILLKSKHLVDQLVEDFRQCGDPDPKMRAADMLKTVCALIGHPVQTGIGVGKAAIGPPSSSSDRGESSRGVPTGGSSPVSVNSVPCPTMLAHPDEFKNPSSFLKIYGDPLCGGAGGGGTSGSANPPKNQNGNWTCPRCRNINFPRRFRCNKCNETRDDAGDRLVADYARHVHSQLLKTFKAGSSYPSPEQQFDASQHRQAASEIDTPEGRRYGAVCGGDFASGGFDDVTSGKEVLSSGNVEWDSGNSLLFGYSRNSSLGNAAPSEFHRSSTNDTRFEDRLSWGSGIGVEPNKACVREASERLCQAAAWSLNGAREDSEGAFRFGGKQSLRDV